MKRIVAVVMFVCALAACRQRTDDVQFIRDMYENVLYEDYGFLEEHCSESLLTRLSEAYDYDGEGYAVWTFRSGAQDGPSDAHKMISIEDEGNGWYRYTAVDMGITFRKWIKISHEGRMTMIEDIADAPVEHPSHHDADIISDEACPEGMGAFTAFAGHFSEAASIDLANVSGHQFVRIYSIRDGEVPALVLDSCGEGQGQELDAWFKTFEKGIPVKFNRILTEFQPTIERIRERGVLLAGTTGDYHPLTFLEPDGSYTGFGIEVAEAIAGELGVGIRFVPTSWPTLSADVLEDPQKFDIAIGGITITDKRLETMLMSEGYLANGKTILCRRTDADRFKSLEDIDKPEVRVMVNPGGTNEQLAREKLTHAAIIVHPGNLEIPGLIAEGAADIMITEITEAPYYTGIDDRLAAPLIDKPFTNGFIGVLMRKGQDDLLKAVNAIIGQMKADGSLKNLHDKYGLAYSLE